MESFKSYLILIESFKDAKTKWVGAGADIDEVTSYIDTFRNLVQKNRIFDFEQKDISTWIRLPFQSFKEFVDSELASAKEKDAYKANLEASRKDAKKVFENENVLVLIPKTHNASCKYGSGTKWCITEEEGDYFNSYVFSQGLTPFFIIPKIKLGRVVDDWDLSKIAVMVEMDNMIHSIWDAKDRAIPVGGDFYHTLIDIFWNTLKIPHDIFESHLEGIKDRPVIEDKDLYAFFNNFGLWDRTEARLDSYFEDWEEEDDDGYEIDPIDPRDLESVFKSIVVGQPFDEESYPDIIQYTHMNLDFTGKYDSKLNMIIINGWSDLIQYLRDMHPTKYKFKE